MRHIVDVGAGPAPARTPDCFDKLSNCAYKKFTIADVGGRASEPDMYVLSGSEARPPTPCVKSNVNVIWLRFLNNRAFVRRIPTAHIGPSGPSGWHGDYNSPSPPLRFESGSIASPNDLAE